MPEESTPIIANLSPAEVLEAAEKMQTQAAAILEEVEQEQFLTLREILSEAKSLVDRLTSAADQLELRLEVMDQRTEQIAEHAEQIKEVIEPTPEPEKAPEIPIIPKAPRKLHGFLI